MMRHREQGGLAPPEAGRFAWTRFDSMQISTAQWEALGRASFTNRMISLLRRHHPDENLDATDSDLEQEIQYLAGRARAHGLDDERSAAIFVYAGWLCGDRFDVQIPAIAGLLAAHGLRANEKAARIQDVVCRILAALEGDDGKTAC